MKIHLQQMKHGALRIEGEASPEALGLEEEGIKPAGPLLYEIDAGLSGGGLFATGRLELTVRLRCVGCLEEFEHRSVINDFAVQVPLDGRECVDLTPQAREDIFLALPPHPKCDATGERTCPASFPSTASGRRNGRAESSASAWAALDQLQPTASKHHGSSKT